MPLRSENSNTKTPEQKLLIKLKKAKNDKMKVEIYNNLALTISYKNAEMSIMYAKKAISIAKNIKDNDGWVTGLCRQALSTTYIGKHGIARKLYREAIKISKDNKLIGGLSRSYQTAGLCAKELGDYSSAIDFYSKALKIINKNDLDKKNLVSLFGNMAGVYAHLEQWDNALVFYHKTFNLIKDDRYHKMVALYNLSYTYIKKHDFKNGELYSRLLLKTAKETNNKLFLAYGNSSLGERYFYEYKENKDEVLLNKAKTYFLKAVNIQKIFDKNTSYTTFLLSVGETLLEQKKFKESFTYIEETLKLSQKLKFKPNMVKAHYYISQAYKGLKNLDKAIFHLEKNRELNTKIHKDNLSKKVSQMMVRFDTLTKEYELNKTKTANESLKKDAKINRYIIMIISIFALLFIFIIILLFVFYRNKKRTADILNILSRTDPLTELLNRRAMNEAIKKEFLRYHRNARPLSFIISDIDHFKKFNDTHGHECGDLVLKKISDLIKKNIREIDYICRWGGEEFLIMLIDTDQNSAKIVSSKLRKIIADNQINWKNIMINVTMSFGVYEYKKGDVIDVCIANADEALYQAKESGRNRVIVSNK